MLLLFFAEKVDYGNEDDGSEQGDEHGGDGDGVVDGAYVEDGAEKKPCEERARDG